jgi:hypothetical protein
MPTDPAPEFIPVTLDRGALEDFRRPFTPEAIRWKIQSAFRDNSGATLISYIDARLVIERLNHVTAIWEDRYVPLGNNAAECSLTVCGVTRRDVGVGQGMTPDVIQKAMFSDALKRAAVKFGIGVSLYALPPIRLRVGSKPSELRTSGNGKPIVDEKTTEALRKGYAKWLVDKGTDMFGEPLDHGDQVGAVGDPDLAESDAAPERLLGPSAAPEQPPLGPNVTAAAQDLREAYSVAAAHWASLADSEKNALADKAGGPLPLQAEFNRLGRAAVEKSSEDDISPIVELQARLERLHG